MILKSQFQFNTQKEIALVTIDDQSIAQLGAWPWPRKYHAQLISILSEAKAEVISFDILFAQKQATDSTLAQSIAQADNVILPYKLDLTANQKGFDFAKREYKVNNITYPTPRFKTGAADMGYLNLIADHEGTIRRLHLLKDLKPLALSTAQEYSHQEKELPRDELLLSFKADKNYFPQISYYQVLRRDFKDGFFEDKIVVVGAKGNSFQDYLSTPLAALNGYLPGMVIHATAIDNYLDDSFMQQLGPFKTGLLIILFSLLTSWLYQQSNPSYNLAICALILIILVVINLSLFIYFDLFIPLLPLGLVLIFNLILSLLSWYLKSEERKNRLKSIFSRYLAPTVVEEILELSEENYLQGKRREITVLFVDINSFTHYSEEHPPAEVVELLNQYLSLITDETFAEGGTLDKFLGDGVMIFFNAPTKEPRHAYKAVKLAIRLQNKIKNAPELALDVSMGINSGRAVVGNIGSTKRSDYTAIGDVVNTAARIEEITPAGEIYIGDGTWQNLGSEFEVELQTKVKLKGKSQNETIYRVIY